MATQINDFLKKMYSISHLAILLYLAVNDMNVNMFRSVKCLLIKWRPILTRHDKIDCPESKPW